MYVIITPFFIMVTYFLAHSQLQIKTLLYSVISKRPCFALQYVLTEFTSSFRETSKILKSQLYHRLIIWCRLSMVILASKNDISVIYNTNKKFIWVFLTLLNTTLKVQTLFHNCLQKFDRFWVSTLFPYLSDTSTNPTDNNGRLLFPCNGNVDNKTKDVSDVLSTSNDHSEMKKDAVIRFWHFVPVVAC